MANNNYLDIDFSTYRQEMEDLLKTRDTFKDYNYKGSNISVLLELIAYSLELNTYYMNKIAKNVYLDSADIYETIHRLSKQVGYSPKGYWSANTTLTVTLSGGYTPGDQIYIPSYTSFSTEDGIEHLTTTDTTVKIPPSASADSYEFDLEIKQGKIDHLEYTAEDLVEYQLSLPNKNYDHDSNSSNNHESVKVYINDGKWTRLNNFYENISGISIEQNAYLFNYNKYKNYVIDFTSTRNYPSSTDSIDVYLIISDGADGIVGANTITTPDAAFVENTTTSSTISLDNTSVTNEDASTAGSTPETETSIKTSAREIFNTQFRCVTKSDFKSYLESMNGVDAVSVGGEQEAAMNGDVGEYNKVYISTIPTNGDGDTITLGTSGGTPVDDEIEIDDPLVFNTAFKNNLSTFLEPRKIINAFEIYILPNLVYFYFEVGLVVKSAYNFSNVSRDIKNKIIYYFDSVNRDFNEIIDPVKIIENIKDSSITSSSDSFANVKGIRYLSFRDFNLNVSVYAYGSDDLPRYTMNVFDANIDNTIRPVELDYNQFPAINKNLITINNEGA